MDTHSFKAQHLQLSHFDCITFHYLFLNSFLSAVLNDMWSHKSFILHPSFNSLIGWWVSLELWTRHGARSWEGGLAGGLLWWNRHLAQAGTREEFGENNSRFDCRDLFWNEWIWISWHETEVSVSDWNEMLPLTFAWTQILKEMESGGRLDKTEGDCSYLRNRLGLLLRGLSNLYKWVGGLTTWIWVPTIIKEFTQTKKSSVPSERRCKKW